MLRTALAAQRTPWLTVFHVGAPYARSPNIAWFPCALLISALPQSRRVALEYRSWQPETTPRFGRKAVRQCYDELARTVEPGAWISRNNTGIRTTDLFSRGGPADWNPDNDSDFYADPVYFPNNATVSQLEAAKALRVFYRSGQRAQHITWINAPAPLSQPVPNSPRCGLLKTDPHNAGQ